MAEASCQILCTARLYQVPARGLQGHVIHFKFGGSKRLEQLKLELSNFEILHTGRLYKVLAYGGQR